MKKDDKEQVIAELTERLRTAETLIVTDYRGLTMPQVDTLRGRLAEHGATFSVVKNTLGRRAAEAAGVDELLALLEGPTAIAFIDGASDAVAVAKALSDSARETKILALRGGILQGRVISGSDIEELAKLPPIDVLRGQVLGAIIAPLTSLLALVNAPLQNLIGLIDARVEQLEAGGDTSGAAAAAAETEAAAEPAAEAPVDAEPETETAQPDGEAETSAEVETETAEPEADAEAPAGESNESEDQEA